VVSSREIEGGAGWLAGGCPVRRVPLGGYRKGTTDEKSPMKANLGKTTTQEVLRNLTYSLEAYLVEWRREHGIRDASEAGIDSMERLSAATEREKEGAEPRDPTS
jgi:hypothetical protein